MLRVRRSLKIIRLLYANLSFCLYLCGKRFVMSKIISSVYVILCWQLLLACSSNAENHRVESGRETFLYIARPRHQFGIVSKQNQKTVCHSFVLENKSKYPIVIGDIDVSCGCMSAKIQSKTILPRSKQELIVCIDLSNQFGHFNKSVFINSSAKNAVIPVRMIGDIIQ